MNFLRRRVTCRRDDNTRRNAFSAKPTRMQQQNDRAQVKITTTTDTKSDVTISRPLNLLHFLFPTTYAIDFKSAVSMLHTQLTLKPRTLSQ